MCGRLPLTPLYTSLTHTHTHTHTHTSYENYKKEYAMDAIDQFFEKHKLEEWFHERYNPHKQREVVMEAFEESRRNSQELLKTGACVCVCVIPLVSDR